MAELITQNSFLTGTQEANLAEGAAIYEELGNVAESPNYHGIVNVVPELLQAVVRETRIEVTGHVSSKSEVDPCSSADAYQNHLVQAGYDALRSDTKHALYHRFAEFITAAAIVRGDAAQVEKSQILGRKIVAQRAHHVAYMLADACRMPQDSVPVLDGTGETLISRADTIVQKRGISPLANTPKADGKRFQVFMDRIRNDDYTKTDLKIDPGRLHEGRFRDKARYTLYVAAVFSQLRKDIKDPMRTVDTVESCYDIVLPPMNFDMTDDDALFIARFSAKINRLLTEAGKRDAIIAADPRTRYVALLSNRLPSANIPKQVAEFERNVDKIVAHNSR